jgi:DNA-binding beta-propeller fold protein YncE
MFDRRLPVGLCLLLAGAGSAAQAQGARKLFVTNQGGATITVLDERTAAVDTVLDLRHLGFSDNAKPHHVVVEPDGSFWYVSLIGDGRVLKFDRSHRLVGQVRMETPGLLALDPAHDSLYVGRSMTAVNPPKSLGVIARSSFTLVEEQEVLVARPHALSVSMDGKWVHTASLAENRIASVETATGRVTLTTIPGAARSLVMFAVSPDGRTMVAGAELSNSLFVFDLTQPPPLVPVREIMVEGKPWEARFAPDNKTVYLTLLLKNGVAVVDAKAGKVNRVLTGSIAQPYSMALASDGRRAFVVSQNTGALAPGQSGHDKHGMVGHDSKDGWLSVLDLRSGKETKTVMLGRGPTGLGAAGLR